MSSRHPATVALMLTLIVACGDALAKEGWTDGISLFGDFRVRYEGFWFDEDPLGNEHVDRHRARYRLRFGAKAEINDYAKLKFRFASGSGSATTRNVTLGAEDDFAPHELEIDQAYLTIHPFGKRQMPAKMKADLLLGKFSNPFRSKKGLALLVWDSDITPDGAVASLAVSALHCFDLSLKSGYLIIDEEEFSKDSRIWALQLGGVGRPAKAFSMGANLSYYGWRALDSDFFTRVEAKGNLPGGLSSDDELDIADVRVWFEFAGIEVWPILIYGNAVRNFSAQNTTGFNAGKEDSAWSVGLVMGDKKKSVQVGAGYFRLEANAIPGPFHDSDFTNGRTNGSVWVFHAKRQLLPNMDLKAELFLSQAAKASISYVPAVDNSKFIRFRADISVKF